MLRLFSIFVCAILFVLTASMSFAEVIFCENGESEYVIRHPKVVEPLAKEFQEFLERSTGRKFRLAAGLSPLAGVRELSLELSEDVVGEGFSHDFRDPARLRIVAGTAEDLAFGVYDFLERYVGVRWIMPGEVGEIVPLNRDIILPPTLRIDVPTFSSRHFPVGRSAEAQPWATRLRSISEISFHHSLGRVFKGQVHGEVAPFIEGERFVPGSTLVGWQPCFSSLETLRIGVKATRKNLDSSSKNTFSLGINDSSLKTLSGFCECPVCLAVDGQRSNFLGKRHRSETYYSFCNQVARLLDDEGREGFRLGCLAYSEVAQAPSFDLEEGIIPFLTFDRHKWIDPKLEGEGRAVTAEWADRASGGIGFYDYMYGTSLYTFPRMYIQQMARNYRFAASVGVTAHYAEYGGWADGPKPYIALKLQWDPYLDVEVLLDEWCRLCVGEAAAPHLRRYYDLWEEFWTSEELIGSYWFQRGRQWLDFSDLGYLDVLDSAIVDETSALMAKVVELAETDRARSRALLLQEAHEFGRMTYDIWSIWRAGDPSPDTMRFLSDALASRRAWVARRKGRSGVTAHRYLHEHPGLNGAGWAWDTRDHDGRMLLHDDFSEEVAANRTLWKFGADGQAIVANRVVVFRKVSSARLTWELPLESVEESFAFKIKMKAEEPPPGPARVRVGFETVDEDGEVLNAGIVASPGRIPSSEWGVLNGRFLVPGEWLLEEYDGIRFFLEVDCGLVGAVSFDDLEVFVN